STTKYFVKIGVTVPSVRALRNEAWVYRQLHLPCMPALVAWQDDETMPRLILEDLSSLQWPPPWSPRTITMALDTTYIPLMARYCPMSRVTGRIGVCGALLSGNPGPF